MRCVTSLYENVNVESFHWPRVVVKRQRRLRPPAGRAYRTKRVLWSRTGRRRAAWRSPGPSPDAPSPWFRRVRARPWRVRWRTATTDRARPGSSWPSSWRSESCLRRRTRPGWRHPKTTTSTPRSRPEAAPTDGRRGSSRYRGEVCPLTTR